MALETLKGVDEIGGFEVGVINLTSPDYPCEYIVVDHEDNEITFKIQNGPIKENGVNGCQVDTLIHAARKIIEGLNEKHFSGYNMGALEGLDLALASLNQRTKDREKRGVEGTSKV